MMLILTVQDMLEKELEEQQTATAKALAEASALRDVLAEEHKDELDAATSTLLSQMKDLEQRSTELVSLGVHRLRSKALQVVSYVLFQQQAQFTESCLTQWRIGCVTSQVLLDFSSNWK